MLPKRLAVRRRHAGARAAGRRSGKTGRRHRRLRRIGGIRARARGKSPRSRASPIRFSLGRRPRTGRSRSGGEAPAGRLRGLHRPAPGIRTGGRGKAAKGIRTANRGNPARGIRTGGNGHAASGHPEMPPADGRVPRQPPMAPFDGSPNPAGGIAKPLVSVIIPAMNERRTIAAVIANARKVHPETEVIVVANGSADGTEETARRMGARVIVFREPLGHDVGRSIGARHAKGDILLFTDGDIVIPAKKLRPFVDAVRQGADVALNRYNGRTLTKHPHPVVVAKHALNTVLRSRHLAGSSMTTVPHAISRRMLQAVGPNLLAVPPAALVSAVRQGLSVSRAAYVEVGRSNPVRHRGKRGDPLGRLIIGDHLEAMARLFDERGPRGGYTDLLRQRHKVR